MKWVLIGDGESPHLLKWARALAHEVELYAASTRGFAPGFDAVVPSPRRFAMDMAAEQGGGNARVLLKLPALARWLADIDPDWLHAHYLTSHGTLALGAMLGWRLRARLIGSAWGSDILVTPTRGWAYHLLTRQILRHCDLCTADSYHMGLRMRQMGANEVMVFPFGLDALPSLPHKQQPWRCFANRGLEPIYRPERVLALFAALAAQQPEARLFIGNDGSLRAALEAQAAALGLADCVRFLGRLDAHAQAAQYAQAQWWFSLPESDSVAVSLLEAMAHGCVPVLSDLPANREVVDPTRGLIVAGDASPAAVAAQMAGLLPHAAAMGAAGRAWVTEHGLFAPAVARFLARVREQQR